ncbi:response regulator receiver domain-containing protein [Anaerobacterium chartisolvens]|uniref:Stage 0 sporulation protein A homolog n=1 Tax=Anaerobacterium chartisolvens TaxID=1297424 RepID=A0A369B3M4_9FIRM|nr:response regulator [Anaerobacterium chartisolvens]RCX14314.1 response regulator receiver domain-containing protein [Anaerobacterium chartisolvens]
MDGTVVILDYADFEREKVKHVLGLMGNFEVIEICSIDEFKPKTDNLENISLFVMDIAFPSEDQGFELLASIKAGIGKNVPTVIISKVEKLQYRNLAAKHGASDFIIRPYNSNRLENSIRGLIRLEKKFFYDTGSIESIVMSFDSFMEKQLYMAEETKNPLSIVVITLLHPIQSTEDNQSFEEKSNASCCIAIDTISPMLGIPDTLIFNKGSDILVVLPLTDRGYAGLCNTKIQESIDSNLKKQGEAFENYFYSVCVTYPEEGQNFQQLMKAAYKKISDWHVSVKSGSIPQKTKLYAKKVYNTYNKWY